VIERREAEGLGRAGAIIPDVDAIGVEDLEPLTRAMFTARYGFPGFADSATSRDETRHDLRHDGAVEGRRQGSPWADSRAADDFGNDADSMLADCRGLRAKPAGLKRGKQSWRHETRLFPGGPGRRVRGVVG